MNTKKVVATKEKVEILNDAIESLTKVGALFLHKDFDKSKQILDMQKELIELRDEIANSVGCK